MQITSYLVNRFNDFVESPSKAKWIVPAALFTGACVYAYRQLCPSRVALFIPYEVSKEHPIELAEAQAKDLLQQLNAADKTNHIFPEYNPERDRYSNILQPVATMVEVKMEGNQVLYNGARFVSPSSGRVYIVMQGPKNTTMKATCAMMDQNEVSQIVCLARAFEDGRPKCHPYWDFWKFEQGEYCTMRTPDESWKPREMLHYEAWPDFGVPEDIDQFIAFVKFQREKYVAGAVCVHCSAGVGRTGVFMVTTLMLDELEKGAKTLNPLRLIQELRKVRPGSVQTEEQLQFCFKIANTLLATHV